MAEYGQYHSVACINATFVGTNSNPPALIYTQGKKCDNELMLYTNDCSMVQCIEYG